MQVQVNIEDSIWQEFVKLEEKKENIDKITEDALKTHIRKLKTYKDILKLQGKVRWEGDLNQLRENRI